MRYLLDTNILSNVIKASPSETLLAWWGEQADQDLFITALTVGEIHRGVLQKPAGKIRKRLEAVVLWSRRTAGPLCRPRSSLR